jgi:AcrR family transcriptional regulator
MRVKMPDMPRNQQHIDRAAKVGRILDAAEELLLRDGYDATTMAAIARGAGVASNAVYWYFPGKDDLLAAVLERRLERAVTTADADSDQPIQVRAMSALAELDAVSILTSTVHERAKHSPAVAKVHHAFHDVLSERAAEGLKSAGMSDGDARMAAAAVIAVIEGIHLHEPSRDPDVRNHLVGWLIQRLTAPRPNSADGEQLS